MCDELQDRVAIVTGGGSGIGEAIAAELRRHGATVIVADTEPPPDAEPDGRSGARIGYRVDVLNREQVEAMAAAAVQRCGRIDVLVNVVGGSSPSLVEATSEDEWDRAIDFNLKGAFLCTNAVLPRMRQGGYGRIVNVSSNYGVTGGAGRSHYAAAKAGIIGFTKSLALEVAPYGITANVLAPGLTATKRVRSKYADEEWRRKEASIPLGRAGRPEDMGPIVALLASDGGQYITGQTIHVNGGMVMP